MRAAMHRSPSASRLQQEKLGLPTFPATTIGSFPADRRDPCQARRQLREGEIELADLRGADARRDRRVVAFQEEIGLDVLVHGEPERNDMVQYFGEQMLGFIFTQNAWVQSYGSRYVRPPIIFGDVSRPAPMTVEWISYAQSKTEKPVKGMLTGPVTMLEWSFVRDDQPRSETCEQLALAIRDEVADLEEAGIPVIHVDEPAIREGLPLRRDRWDEYLRWAIYSFRVTTSGVADETQVHTHMCYSDFGDIMERIQEMDADVTLIEAARSRMELLHDWERTGYTTRHRSRASTTSIPRACRRWRRWPSSSTRPPGCSGRSSSGSPPTAASRPGPGTRSSKSLRNMVQAAKQLREELVPAS